MMRQRQAAAPWLSRAPAPRGQQLHAADDPLLRARDRANCLGFVPVSGRNPRQFAHTAMVGAMLCRRYPGLRQLCAATVPLPSVMQFVTARTPSEAGHLPPTAHDASEQRS
jgi:hypothetical protein